MTLPLTEKNSNSSLRGQSAIEKIGLKSSSVETDLIHSELPGNFAEVVKGVYRSSFPHPWNLPALKKLGLKVIITLVEEPFTPSHLNFLKENGITHHRILIQANKDPADRTPDHVINRVLEILLNRANHPILVHCNKGKHRTGCIVGCFRKVQGWDMQSIISEYLNYSWPKSRTLDEKFIDAFDASKVAPLAQTSGATSWQSTSHPKCYFEQNDLDQTSPKRRIHTSFSEVDMPDII